LSCTTTATRRTTLMLCAAALATPALAGPPATGRLRFTVLRNGTHVGEHAMSFTRAGGDLIVTTDVEMAIKLGPVPVFRYAHHAAETVRGGQFARLETATSSNGKKERVLAIRGPDGVRIETAQGAATGAADLAPFTHWDSRALAGPLFNPQTGRVLKVRASRQPADALPSGAGLAAGTRWAIRGDANIDNWYDASGVWAALRGTLPDGSTMTYRRV
jgi:hypothetical protein